MTILLLGWQMSEMDILIITMNKNTRDGKMGHEVNLLEKLESKLNEICGDDDLVKGILFLLETDEERQTLLEIAEEGGEEATPKNLTYAAINMDDERKHN